VIQIQTNSVRLPDVIYIRSVKDCPSIDLNKEGLIRKGFNKEGGTEITANFAWSRFVRALFPDPGASFFTDWQFGMQLAMALTAPAVAFASCKDWQRRNEQIMEPVANTRWQIGAFITIKRRNECFGPLENCSKKISPVWGCFGPPLAIAFIIAN
jgi:hypothetical protein